MRLVEEFRYYARRPPKGNVFVSTHSPELLDAARLEEVVWFERVNVFTKLTRATDDPFVCAVLNDNDNLGEMWVRNYLGVSRP